MRVFLSVDPKGNVLPIAQAWPEPVGNLLEEGFNAVWFITRAVLFERRNLLHEECKECRNFTACQGACSSVFFNAHGKEELFSEWVSMDCKEPVRPKLNLNMRFK